MVTVYVLCSIDADKIYVGMTKDLARRMREHERGLCRSTKGMRPFQLLLSEEYPDYNVVRAREIYLKSTGGRAFIRNKRV